ncbi:MULTISPECIES: LPS export ABC transporter periplasmic protein LptC [Silvimonas]|uniref:LPS export ABC transporter periplasmic protein LptC n=1 Tax=Silvimonas TaxID=300264 RepID=UPI0024B376EB|nr:MULTISPECIES: LPS export ABC transporter periplasmic protein LptC [Silvimonas]MDR3425942.1 LPS export ABC transporter periplasmic protein LptC [Silvimonas sp.]
MNSLSSRLLPLVLIVFLALLVWGLNSAATLPALDNQRLVDEPNLIANNTHTVRFDELGRPFERLDADKVSHYEENDSAWFDNPHLVSTAPGKPRVDLVTTRAQSINKGEKLWMPEPTTMTRQPDAQHAQMVIHGREIWYQPKPGDAWSEAPVDADMGAYHAKGVGFQADLAGQTLLVKSRVSTTYVPAQRSSK